LLSTTLAPHIKFIGGFWSAFKAIDAQCGAREKDCQWSTMETKVNDHGELYDILGYVFSYFICVWRQIRGHLEDLSRVWGIFCIVIIWVVVIHFYPNSCNFTGVLSLFHEKSWKSTKQDITWRIEDIKNEDQWFLEGFLRQYKLGKINPKFEGIHFKTEEHYKKERKLQKSHRSYCLMRPYTWAMRNIQGCLMRPYTPHMVVAINCCLLDF